MLNLYNLVDKTSGVLKIYQQLLYIMKVNPEPGQETAKSRQRGISRAWTTPYLARIYSDKRSQELLQWAISKKNIKRLGTGCNKK